MSTPGPPIPCPLAEPSGCCTTPPPTEYCIVEWGALCFEDVWGTPFPFAYCTPTLPPFPMGVWRKDGLGGASLWNFGVGPCPTCDPGATPAGPTGPCVDPITTTPPPGPYTTYIKTTWSGGLCDCTGSCTSAVAGIYFGPIYDAPNGCWECDVQYAVDQEFADYADALAQQNYLQTVVVPTLGCGT